MTLTHLSSRAVLEISGADAPSFLQGLVTNDVIKSPVGAVIYAAMLTPQGKIFSDFLVHKTQGEFLLDVPSSKAEALLASLKRYRLRADVSLTLREDLYVAVGEGMHADPRLPALMQRGITTEKPAADDGAYTAHRLSHGIVEGDEINTERAFALDYGFEELHGVDFTKGCYVGQEVTARMHYKAVDKKGLYLLHADDALSPRTPITKDGAEVGEVLAVAGAVAVGILRHEAAAGTLFAGCTSLTAQRPTWAKKNDASTQ